MKIDFLLIFSHMGPKLTQSMPSKRLLTMVNRSPTRRHHVSANRGPHTTHGRRPIQLAGRSAANSSAHVNGTDAIAKSSKESTLALVIMKEGSPFYLYTLKVFIAIPPCGIISSSQSSQALHHNFKIFKKPSKAFF